MLPDTYSCIVDVSVADKPGVRLLQNTTSDLGLTQLVRAPTRIAAVTRGGQLHTTSTLIDLAFTPEPDSVTDVTVEEHDISDHKCVLLSLRVPRPRGNRRTVTIRSTRNLNEDAIKLDFLMTDWSPVYVADCINSKWTAWLQIWNSVVDVHCPYVTKPVKSTPAPWLHDNPERRAALLARDCAHSRADRSGLAADWAVFHELRCRASEFLSDAKSAYFDSLLEDSRNIWPEVGKYLLQKKAPATSSQSRPSQEEESAFAAATSSQSRPSQ